MTSFLPFLSSSSSKAIPSVPRHLVFGSMPYYKKRYGDPRRNQFQIYLDNYNELCKPEGSDVFISNIPGMGTGLAGTIYHVINPKEYLKIIQNEGRYPSGSIEVMWPLKAWFRDRDKRALTDFFSHGENWKRLRSVMQKNLFAPSIAPEKYASNIMSAAKVASKGAPLFRNDLNGFSARTSFDMFCSAFYGKPMGIADPSSNPDVRDVQFCEVAIKAGQIIRDIIYSPREIFLHRIGYQTVRLHDYYDALDQLFAYSDRVVDEFVRRYNDGCIEDVERDSYLSATLSFMRSAEYKSTVSEEDIKQLMLSLLAASTDTTSSLINWNVINLALNPRVQERLHSEIVSAYGDGEKQGLSERDILTGQGIGYLDAVIRETHRIRPPLVNAAFKKVASDVVVGGHVIPRGSVTSLITYPLQNDPEYVDNPHEFQPERFLPESVKEREGSPSHLIDHVFMRAPFSQGARKCPGYRVAAFEVQAILTQLVKDWKIEIDNSTAAAGKEVRSLSDVGYIFDLTIQPGQDRFLRSCCLVVGISGGGGSRAVFVAVMS